MPAAQQEIVTIAGTLTAWRTVKDGWGFGELRPAKGPTVAVVGSLMARVHDQVEVRGIWVEHPRFGRQLKVRECNRAVPDSAEGVIAWLSSTLPDVGATRARKLLDHFVTAAELWRVIESDPDALTAVEGITPGRAHEIKRAYMAHRSERDHMITLRGWGLTDSQIARCVNEWAGLDKVIARVHANPYDLAKFVHGFGFLRADKVAKRIGIAHDAPERLQAGVEYTLETKGTDAGHCWLWGKSLQREAGVILEINNAQLLADAVRVAIQLGRIVRAASRYYPRRLAIAERTAAETIARLRRRTNTSKGTAYNDTYGDDVFGSDADHDHARRIATSGRPVDDD